MRSKDYSKDTDQMWDRLLADIQETYLQCQESGLADIGYVAIDLGVEINEAHAYGVGVDADGRVFVAAETEAGEDVIAYAEEHPVGLTVETLADILNQLESELEQFGRFDDDDDEDGFDDDEETA